MATRTRRALLDTGDGIRLAFSTLSAIPIGPPPHVDRTTAGRAMLAAPLVGAALGGIASAIGWGVWQWSGNTLLAALTSVGTLAATTRGLHLDGLADTADALGSAKPAEDALRIMKASDIGPFGVITLILTLIAQTALVAELWQHGASHAAAALIVAAAAGRLTVAWACRPGIPSARPDGLGAWVAGSVGRGALATTTAATLAAATAIGAFNATTTGATTTPATHLSHLILWPIAVATGIAASAAFLRHTVKRFGGITGDVLGALVEIGFTATLFVLLRA